MTTDVFYPMLIVLGCLLIVVVVHRLTRPRPSRDDINLPKHALDGGTLSPSDLRTWHVSYEGAVLDYLDVHDPADGAGEPPVDAGAAFDAAVLAHPSAEMQAELAAMRAAAEGVAAAVDAGDETPEHHRELYLHYRAAWLERLRQFPVDEARVLATERRNLSD